MALESLYSTSQRKIENKKIKTRATGKVKDMFKFQRGVF